MTTTNNKFLVKNGLAVGAAVDVINSNGEWIGATGALSGATGVTGASGIGATGVTGASGIGNTGLTGATGIQGVQGIQGIQGASGSTGIQGASGSTGIIGASGIQGASGSTGIQGASGIGATGIGASGLTGATGLQGPTGQSSSFYNYKAKTSIQTGDPLAGRIIWNNVTLTSATQINISHITDDVVDVDLWLGLLNQGDIFTIQEADDSTRFQRWEITGTPTPLVNQYYQYPVTLLDSGGTALGNNNPVILAIVYTPTNGATGATGIFGATGVQGASGIQGASGSTGTAGSNGASGIQGASGSAGSNGTAGATGIQGVQGIQGIQGASGSTGIGATGVQGASGIGATGVTGPSAISNWISGATGATLIALSKYLFDTSSSAFSISLPATPNYGDEVTIADNNDFSINNLTISPNGNSINYAFDDLLVDVKDIIITFVYNGTTWKTYYEYWQYPAGYSAFAPQGDLNSLSGIEDLNSGSGTYDLQTA